jgi:hypothetical protein
MAKTKILTLLSKSNYLFCYLPIFDKNYLAINFKIIMSNLIERIKHSAEYAEKQGENMDDVSWGMEEGVLISYNEAKTIVSMFEALKAVVIISDRKHIAWDKAKAAMAKAANDKKLPKRKAHYIEITK